MTLSNALIIAVGAHFHQRDQHGRPYLMHVIRVAGKAWSEDQMIVAVLHDVFEDTDRTPDELDLPSHIRDALVALTRRESETYADYIGRVGENPLARSVKLDDLEVNLHDCPGSLRPRYERARHRLLGWTDE